jgi:electron transport complex protein RnfB
MPVKIDYERCCWKDGKATCSCTCCVNGKGCIAVCPVEAITRNDVVRVDDDKCIDCGVCVEVCPSKALSME